jgi:hypothetical protein
MDEIAMICRQTAYSEAEAQEKLAELGDPVKVIQGYMQIQKKSAPIPSRNANKLIYQELGKFVSSSFSGTSGK